MNMLLEECRTISDDDVVSRVRGGETGLYEMLMRRYNQRLYRVARAILRDDAEAEDVMQDAYVRAYQHLDQFEGRAKFATWLTRIAVHEALARSERRSRFQPLNEREELEDNAVKSLASNGRSPEEQVYDRELRAVLEGAVLSLPDDYRLVFMLRDVEGLNTEETATCLDLTPENVKVRLHRSRAALREKICAQLGEAAARSFTFGAARCDRMVHSVFRSIAALDRS